MCGIAGVFSIKNNVEISSYDLIKRINHRGPDNLDIWKDDYVNLSFGHARLSIQDLSSKANQPMHSSSNRYVISFNGEIYNHYEVRKKLII